MYYTGLDRTMDPVYVPKSPHEKAMQRALIQYRNPENYELSPRGTAPDTPRGGSDRIRTEMSRTTEKMAGEAGKPSRGKGSNGKGFGQKTANERPFQTGKSQNRRTAEKDAPQRAQNRHAEDERGSYRRREMTEE